MLAPNRNRPRPHLPKCVNASCAFSISCKFSGAFIAPWMVSGTRAAYCSRRRPNRHDVTKNLQPTNLQSARNALRLGFVPQTDCAPLVMAEDLDLFRKYGLCVTLSRELG